VLCSVERKRSNADDRSDEAPARKESHIHDVTRDFDLEEEDAKGMERNCLQSSVKIVQKWVC
jgi:hypothetical protein